MNSGNDIALWASAARSLFAGCAALILAGCASADATRDAQAPDAQALQADHGGSTLRLARASRAANDLASAVNLYRSALAASPQDATIQAELGDTLVDAGSYDDAIYAYNQIGPQSPARVHALLGLMRIELILNEPVKALAYADEAKAIAPQDIKVLIGRGVALDTDGRHAEAQQSYRAAIAIEPHNVAARNDLALSLALTGSFDEAIQIMEPIALSSNATPRCRQNLALIYGLKGDDAHASSLSRLDLDAAAAAANLRLFALVRAGGN